MSKKPIKKDIKAELNEKLTDIDLLRNYYEKTKMPDTEFSSLQKFDSFSVAGGVDIPNPLMAKHLDGTSDLFTQYVLEEIEPNILDRIEVRGLNKEHALTLIQDGMTSLQVLQAVETLPGKESEEMLMLIQSQYEPELLKGLETLGITVQEVKDGKLQVKALSKVAEVSQDGKTKLSPKLENELAVFEQMGLVSLSEDLTIEIIDPKEKDLVKEEKQGVQETEEQEMPESGLGQLKIVPIKEKNKALTQDEIKKTKIAKELDVEPQDVECCIRFASREVASQYFNDTVDMNHTAILVRLKNNKFWMMEEDGQGNWTKRQDMRVSPASKLLADKLKDTKHKGDTWVLPGEVRSGKTHENSERYDFFEVMLPGEDKIDGASSAMYVGLSTSNVQDMRLISSRNNNVYELVEDDVRSVIPSRVFINSNQGESTSIDLDSSKEHKLSEKKEQMSKDSSISLVDLGKRSELLHQLLNIEKQIEEIEINKNNDLLSKKEMPKEELEPDISDSLMDDKSRLPSLYQERSQILTQLGLDESTMVETEITKENDEMEHFHRLGGNH